MKKGKGERHHIYMVKKLAIQAQAPFKKNLKSQWTRNNNLLFILFP
jgi:hypothetical protein